MTFLEEGPSDERSEGWESEQNHLGPNPSRSARSVAGMLIPLIHKQGIGLSMFVTIV